MRLDIYIKPREHGDCMFRNEWLKEFNFKPWDVGYLGAGSLWIKMSNKSTGEIPQRPAYKVVPKDASQRPCYNGASLYPLERYLSR